MVGLNRGHRLFRIGSRGDDEQLIVFQTHRGERLAGVVPDPQRHLGQLHHAHVRHRQ